MFIKRTVIIGEYDTAAHDWTLTGWKLTDPEQKTNYVEKIGSDGSWDMSTALTDGIPRYKDRSLVVTLECSEGTRADRESLISEMVNRLDGLEWRIVLPDHPEHYLIGRVHVAVDYSDMAHAAVTITATCGPWLYMAAERSISVTLSDATHAISLENSGRLAMVPTLVVEDNVVLVYGTASIALTVGTYQWPELLLTPGSHSLECSGSGKLAITYREAVLR